MRTTITSEMSRNLSAMFHLLAIVSLTGCGTASLLDTGPRELETAELATNQAADPASSAADGTVAMNSPVPTTADASPLSGDVGADTDPAATRADDSSSNSNADAPDVADDAEADDAVEAVRVDDDRMLLQSQAGDQRFQILDDQSIRITSATTTSYNGTVILEWGYTGAPPETWWILESESPEMDAASLLFADDTEPPYRAFIRDLPAGTYYYQVGLPQNGPRSLPHQVKVLELTIAVQPRIVRFVNDTVYPLRSVVIDGEELLEDGEIVPGRLSGEDNWVEFLASPYMTEITYAAQSAFYFDTGMQIIEEPMYEFNGTVRLEANDQPVIRVNDPTIGEILSRGKEWNSWIDYNALPGSMFGPPNPHWIIIEYRAFRDGSYEKWRTPKPFGIEGESELIGRGEFAMYEYDGKGDLRFEVIPWNYEEEGYNCWDDPCRITGKMTEVIVDGSPDTVNTPLRLRMSWVGTLGG